jgi:hypothetical protein
VEPILVRGEPAVLSEVYRSTSGGWVVERDESDDGVVVTLRLAHQFQELRGLNMLAALFDGLEFPEMVEELFAVHMQSDIIHSHLEIAGSQGQVAAAMNGLWATLPATFDRRFPLVRESMIGGDLPPYTIQPPPVSVRQGGRFVAWNSPSPTAACTPMAAAGDASGCASTWTAARLSRSSSGSSRGR